MFLNKWRTSPTHWLDWTLWPLLRLVWEPFSRKRTHWWQWRTYTGQIEYPLVVQGHPDETNRSSWWNNFYQTNFGWKYVVILRPEDYSGVWHIGFSAEQMNGRLTQYCTVLFNGQDQVAPLVGPFDTTFFAFTKEGKPIKLLKIKETTKSALPKSISLI
jgi:hypothetical protein